MYQLTANHRGAVGGDEETYAPGLLRWTTNYDDPFTVQTGVQPAYTEYKGMVSRNSGNMAGSLRFWTFMRRYTNDGYDTEDAPYVGSPFNTYVFPQHYNYAWAVTDGTSNPFVCSIGLDIKIKRPISRVQLNTAIV